MTLADIVSFIVNKFNKKITIDVSPETFVFSNDDATVAMGTYLYLLSNSKGDYVILAVGEQVQEAGCVRVNLFHPEPVPPDKVLRFDCLQSFLRFGFAKVSKRKTMLRPSVLFRGDNSLGHITCGYQRKLLSDAATSAGAHSVRFLD